jgi:hypothetical protein
MSSEQAPVGAQSSRLAGMVDSVCHVLEVLLPHGATASERALFARRVFMLGMFALCFAALGIIVIGAFTETWFFRNSFPAPLPWALAALTGGAEWVRWHPASWLLLPAALIPGVLALPHAGRFSSVMRIYALLAALVSCLILYAMSVPVYQGVY